MSEKDIATALGLTAYNVKTRQVEGNIRLLRQKVTIAKNALKKAKMQEAWDHYYKDKMSPQAIAEEMHISLGTVNKYISPANAELERRKDAPLRELRDEVDSKGYVDVGKSSNKALGVTESMLRGRLIPELQNEGYELHKIGVRQLGTGNTTNMMVLCKPGTTLGDVYKHQDEIMPLGKFTINDNGETKLGMVPPKSIDSSRVMVNYADTGTGLEKDGVIELRRGVEDISLGKAQYAQVRIAVDGTHYLKGMAVYADDLPDGIDIRFNTNKNSSTPMMGDKDHSVLKLMSDNKDNPFGATILQDRDLTVCQQFYQDKNGEKQQSLINVVTEEGKWDTWSKTLASQFLSKQDYKLADKQLKLAAAYKKDEFDEIKNLTNPVLKKKLLEEYASGCDSDAVHLKAAALPRQASKVILPVSSLKDGEIYAPGYRDGETLALVRYPHGGVFEIASVKVNNSNKEAIRVLGKTPTDAVGINAHTASQLSGADFDGDTVVVIPYKDARGVKKINIKTEDYPKALKEFDPKAEYKLPDGVPAISDRRKQTEMGMITNLITDMTLMGAKQEEIIRATKHSMVVIDAVKHRLDVEKSARDNNIAELHRLYQGNAKGGAVTIVSKASSQLHAEEERAYYKIDSETGQKIKEKTGGTHLSANKSFKEMDEHEKLAFNKAQTQYKRTGIVPDPIYGKAYLATTKAAGKLTEEEKATLAKAQAQYKATGKIPEPINGLKFKEKRDVLRFKEEVNKYKTTKMAYTEDATTLMSPSKYPMERVYANYANTMKAMANEARKELVATKNIEMSKSAAKTYATEVASLMAKLDKAELNQPRERLATRAANSEVKAILNDHPEYKDDHDKLQKIKNQALSSARSRFGSNKKEVQIHPTEKEWNAIQAGAISSTTMKKIFDNCDSDELKRLATPRTSKADGLTSSKIALIKALKASGSTLTEIADKLGYSPSTISKAINGTL